MSQQRGRGDAGDAVREPRAGPGRVKRRKTRGERNRAKFGPGVRGARWRGGRHPWVGFPPPRAAQPPPSPLPPPRPVIITQQRLCRPRGLLGRGVASMDIKRLLEGGQGERSPPRPPAEELTGPLESPGPVKGMEKEGQRSPSPPVSPSEKAVGDRDSFSAVTSARGLAARLCALLPQPAEFWGRALAEERRRTLLAALLEHHHNLPDLSTLLPHKSVGAAGGLSHAQLPVLPPASQPPPGLSTAEAELLPQPVQSRDPALHHSHPPTPPQAITQSPTSPSQFSPPVFNTETKKRQSLFPWMSEDEDDTHPENPAPQFWVRTPPPPFRPTPPAHSPISHPRTPSPPAVLPPPVFGAQRRERQLLLSPQRVGL
ncbi:proline-rich protein 19 [Tympanuchus pallidicinctus]|uniref:proline-rich protein 19 n=1 Tax=Tympanuchus pallidicinctus TaxID=109042 RepID=UPI0022870942|nr:proline-rich protein 19 [Tympanuchus pallidicinctus]